MTFVLPLAFVNWYPSLHILGREDPLGYPDWTQWLSPAVAAAAGGRRPARVAHRRAPVPVDGVVTMALIEVERLTRTFRVPRRGPTSKR